MKPIIVLFLAFSCLSQAVLASGPTEFGDIAEFVVKPATQTIIEQLRDGGYVLYMRHGNTDTSRPDQINMDFNDCSTQRPLSGKGRSVVTKVGRAMRKATIPIGDVFSSPMCRAKESALIAFGKNITVENLLRYTSNMKDNEKLQSLDMARELLSRPVQGKVNRVIVAHSQNMMALIGYLPKPEGTVVIFRPMGNMQFKYIASVKPTQWETLQP